MIATVTNRSPGMRSKRRLAGTRRALLLGGVVVVASTLTGCVAGNDQHQIDLGHDIRTCTEFGANYGSPDHYQCMLVQQRRRDREPMDALKRERISSETAGNMQKLMDNDTADPARAEPRNQRDDGMAGPSEAVEHNAPARGPRVIDQPD